MMMTIRGVLCVCSFLVWCACGCSGNTVPVVAQVSDRARTCEPPEEGKPCSPSPSSAAPSTVVAQGDHNCESPKVLCVSASAGEDGTQNEVVNCVDPGKNGACPEGQKPAPSVSKGSSVAKVQGHVEQNSGDSNYSICKSESPPCPATEVKEQPRLGLTDVNRKPPQSDGECDRDSAKCPDGNPECVLPNPKCITGIPPTLGRTEQEGEAGLGTRLDTNSRSRSRGENTHTGSDIDDVEANPEHTEEEDHLKKQAASKEKDTKNALLENKETLKESKTQGLSAGGKHDNTNNGRDEQTSQSVSSNLSPEVATNKEHTHDGPPANHNKKASQAAEGAHVENGSSTVDVPVNAGENSAEAAATQGSSGSAFTNADTNGAPNDQSTPDATAAENVKDTKNSDSSVSPVCVHAPLLLLAFLAVAAVS
ncbi:hypothetical protein DQ04_18771000 [Trypanosoma grayi]|uniref:hypothetical protein n=1 Tax=Trypanosoma grayi TaxID=71804 RepID=UPI0004F401F7|nr:hypothetical protein DQ04_18771000 [Trypanosoma grayi]KEG05746.1 hypothetical protein DQ04_18771000 [Trypanosoma grayi]